MAWKTSKQDLLSMTEVPQQCRSFEGELPVFGNLWSDWKQTFIITERYSVQQGQYKGPSEVGIRLGGDTDLTPLNLKAFQVNLIIVCKMASVEWEQWQEVKNQIIWDLTFQKRKNTTNNTLKKVLIHTACAGSCVAKELWNSYQHSAFCKVSIVWRSLRISSFSTLFPKHSILKSLFMKLLHVRQILKNEMIKICNLAIV